MGFVSLSTSDHTAAAPGGQWKRKGRVSWGEDRQVAFSHSHCLMCLYCLSSKPQGTLGFHGLKKLSHLPAARVLQSRPQHGVTGAVFSFPSGTSNSGVCDKGGWLSPIPGTQEMCLWAPAPEGAMVRWHRRLWKRSRNECGV